MKKHNDVWEMIALIGQIGITMIVAIAIGTAVFVYLGRLCGISWLAVIGFAIGAAAGFKSVYKLVKKYLDRR